MKTFASAIIFIFVAAFISIPSSYATYSFEEWNLASLQKKYSRGKANPTPWVSYWWPYVDSGISNGEFDRKQLSPAEKIDLALGNRNWATNWEYQNHGPGRNPADWWGHCHGWAVAAIMENEPRSQRTVNDVEFGVQDRKALIAEYWMEAGSDFIGTRVWDSNDFSSKAFWDVVPAQFHLAMTNIVGREQQAIIIDRYTGAEVWNQPVVGYEIEPIGPDDYLGAHSRYRNVYRVNVTATIWWANDEVEPNDVTPPFEWKENDFFTRRKLRYELWVDAPLKFDSSGKLVSSGNIVLTNNGIGGQWKNGTSREALVESHPDFIWIPLSYSRPSGGKNPRINDAWIRANLRE